MTSEGCPPLDLESPLDEVWGDQSNLPVVKIVCRSPEKEDYCTEVSLKEVYQRRKTYSRGKFTTIRFQGCVPFIHVGTYVEVDEGQWSGTVVSSSTVWSSEVETTLLLG